MQSIHFLQSENQEGNKLDLNNLQPVSEYQKQVVLSVEEKLDGKMNKFFNETYDDKDKTEAIKKYRILGKYFDIYSEFENHSFSFHFLDNNLRNFFVVGKKANEKVIDFLYEKGIFRTLNDFLLLADEYIIININEDIFIKNYEYLEKNLGRNLNKEDFTKNNFIDFIKEGDSKDIDVLFKEFSKNGLNLSKEKFLKMIFLDDGVIKFGEYEFSAEKIVNFCLRRGLIQKLEFLYSKKGEFFDILNILDNYEIESKSIMPIKDRDYVKEIVNFKNNVSLLIAKYPDLDISDINVYKSGIFKFLDNLGENVFLFEEFDISYDYFKNENSEKFFNFLTISSTKLLKFLIGNIKGIKFKDLFAIYKVNGYLFTGSFVKTLKNRINDEEYTEFYINFFKYAINNQNYYFLENNLSIFTKFYKNKTINYNFGFEKIKEVLDKTGGFITKSLFENYVLQENSDLDEIWKKYQNAMRKVLSSEEIKQEEFDDFLYEAIFMAYRPTGFSEEKIKKMIENGEIKDLTHQLDDIKFSREGYKLVIYKNKRVLESKSDEKFLYNSYSIVSGKEVKEFFNKNFLNEINFKTFFSKSTELQKIEKIIRKFYSINNDPRLDFFKDKFLWYDFLKGKKTYILLNNLYEIFGVVTKDSFLKYIIEELEKQEDETIDDIFAKIQKIKDVRFKKEFENVSNENINDKNNIKIEEKKIIIAKLTEKRIIEFGQFMRKKIKQELKKFKITRGEEKQFKAIISKNIGSFFAKAGAELCTANDKSMWNEQRHIHLNLIDEEINQIVGNIMLYFEENRDYLIVRGFNPIRQIVDNYDNKQLVSEMIRVVKQIAKENGFDRVYIPKVNFWWHNLSNRDKIQKLVWNESQKNNKSNDYIIENAGFYQTSVLCLEKVNRLYLL